MLYQSENQHKTLSTLQQEPLSREQWAKVSADLSAVLHAHAGFSGTTPDQTVAQLPSQTKISPDLHQG